MTDTLIDQDPVITLPHNWTPRPDQLNLWRFLEKNMNVRGMRAVVVAHRRWGKDDVALHFTATAAHERIGNYWHMLPLYTQGRKAIWEAINPRTGMYRINEAFPVEIRDSTRHNDMVLKLRVGSQWQVVGSDNYDAYVGSPPIGVVLSEYALSNPMAWAYLQPILEENGGWALFLSTSRGKNHLKAIYDFAKGEATWYSEMVPATMSSVYSMAQLAAIEREYWATYGEETGRALYNQEYLCSFEGAVYGAYYAKQLAQATEQKRITSVPWQSGVAVDVAFDLGMDDSTTIWFWQTVGREIRMIDYYENSGMSLEHYAKVLKEKPYLYGDHYFPHDVEVRELGTGKSRREVAEALGMRPITTVERARDQQSVLNGIEAGRNIFSRIYFDEKRCAKGLQALEGYRAEYDEEKKKLSNKPLHDWCSHGADAFRTFAVGFEDKVLATKPDRNRPLRFM